jgi:hypothetical protein
MSDYYLAAGKEGGGAIPQFLTQLNVAFITDFVNQLDPNTPMRSWFVGFLFVLGVVMIVYQGLTPRENWLLNFAGLFALGVALFPTGGCVKCGWLTVHGVSAGASFLCLAAVAVLGAKQVVRKELGKEKTRFYQTWYWIAAIAMLASPVVAWLLTQFVGANYFVFLAEMFGLWFFAGFWGLKSLELADEAEKKVMDKSLAIAPAAAAPATMRVDDLVPEANS